MTRTALEAAAATIADRRGTVPATRSVLVALTGIDGCGKGYVTAQLDHALRARGLHAAAVNADGWLHLPHVRFDDEDPGEHFYHHAFRFDQLFDELVLPLRDRRSLRLEAHLTEETATTYRRHLYDFRDVDVILLEGIFLLRRELRSHYDLSFWIACTFETALERAIARAQEDLPPEETAAAYRSIFFPAQEIHRERDAPEEAATAIIDNDPRLRSR